MCHRENAQAADGAPRESTGACRLVSFLGMLGGGVVRLHYPSRRARKISLVPLNVTRSWSEEGRKGKLWQKPTLSSRYACSPGQGTYSLFVDMLRAAGERF